MVAKAIALDVICAGDIKTKDGSAQLVLLSDPKHQKMYTRVYKNYKLLIEDIVLLRCLQSSKC